MILVFACAPQQPAQPVSNMPVPGNENIVEKIAVEEPKLAIGKPKTFAA